MFTAISRMKTYHLSLAIDEGSDEFWDELDQLPSKAHQAAKLIEGLQEHLEHLGFSVKIDLVRIEE